MKRVVKALDNATSLGGIAHPMLARFIRYTLTASSFSALDIIILFIFVDFLGIFYLYAATFSFIIANTAHYFVVRNWGFKGSKRKRGEGYLWFIGISVMSLTITLVLLEYLVDDAGWHYIPAKILIAVIVGIINFFVHYYFTFKIHKNGNGKR